MIVTYEKHGRSARDAACLLVHLQKPENESVRLLEIGNSVALDMAGVIRDMQILRDGSSAKAAFHHLSINPARTLSDDALLKAVHAVRAEMDPDLTRPFFIVEHVKARVGTEAGVGADAGIHAHLVLGHVDGRGRSLIDGRSKIRTEATARINEFFQRDVSKPMLGRHHKQVLKILRRRGLHDVAAWMVAAHGEDPERPRAAMSSRSRQRAKRAGVDLPKAKAMITAAWAKTRAIGSFKAELANQGYAVVTGTKPGVFIIVDNAGNTVGSVDRLLRLRRRAVKELMERNHERETTEQGGLRPSPADGRTRPQATCQIGGDQRAAEAADAAPRPLGIATSRGGRRSDSDHRPAAGDVGGSNAGRRGQTRSFADELFARAMIQLRLVGRLAARRPACIRTLQDFETYGGRQLPRRWGVTDIWGVGILPKP